ncbi:MAG TPA: PT domain-containing protein [Anaerolineaceae bacterium]|nr:PT domain-containing protein [Anaerolineaceae bacterium]
MSPKSIKTLSAILIVLVLLTLSCEFSFDVGGKKDGTTTPEIQQVTSAPAESVVEPTQSPTEAPPVAPTAIPPTAVPTQPPMPTDEPIAQSEPYYTEEFDYVPDNWYYEVLVGNEDKADISVADGKLTFTIEDYDTYAYVFYEDYTYTNVYIEASTINRGSNDNMVTLVCRYSDSGFYEVNITNGGLYDIYAYVEAMDMGYIRLYNGGSRNINMGMKSNTFAMSCEGKEIKLWVNGVLERTVEDNNYNLPEGLIGVGVSSFDALPVIIDFDYVYIDVP